MFKRALGYDWRPFLLPMNVLTLDIHLLTNPFLLRLLVPLIDDDVEGSSYSKLLEDDEDEAVDVGEVSGSSDFARDGLLVEFVVGDSSRTKDETDSVPSANLFIRLRPVVDLIKVS